MKILTCRPPPLAGFVDLFWFATAGTHGRPRERVLPQGTVELVMRLADGAPGPLVCGAHSTPFEIGTADPAPVVGVHFRPGGAFPFLGLPVGALQNAHVSLDALWGRAAAALRDRLLEARTPPAMFAALEQALLAHARRPLARHPAVDFALTQFRSGLRAPPVGEVIDAVGLSPRRFVEVFTEQVGLTPKRFSRIQRFQSVLRLVQGREQVNWARVAQACEYYDQAHFARDFREFAGLAPAAYLRARTEHLNHIAVPG